LFGSSIFWLLLLAIASGCQSWTPDVAPGRGSKEKALRENLYAVRQGISHYTQDKKRAPQTLDDLVNAGYLKSVPKDPFTGQADWVLEREDASAVADKQRPGIVDIHSASGLRAVDGSAYNSW
jgi:general secretion pathway protein G